MGYIVRDSGIRIPSATTAPKFSHLAAASGAGANIEFDPQAATTSGSSGSFLVNVAAPASGTTEAGLFTERAGVLSAFLGQANGLPNSGQIGLGSGASPGNAGNYILANSGLLTVNAQTTGVRLATANVNICDFLAANANFYKPVQGGTTGTAFQWGQAAVTLGATGSTALTGAQQQAALLVMSIVTLTGAITLDFGGVIGNWLVDFSQVTISAQTVTLKNGAGTVSATAILATKSLLAVSGRTAALVNVG